MDKTIGYVLCCQSPALFLLTLVLLFASLLRRKRHKFIAAIDVILAVASAVLGVALYFIGMRYEHFTIDDFYHVRTVGWVGVGLVAVVSAVTGLKAFMKMADERRTQKAAIRAENARINQERMAAEAEARAAAQAAKEAETAAQEAAQEASRREVEKVTTPVSQPEKGFIFDPGPIPDRGSIQAGEEAEAAPHE